MKRLIDWRAAEHAPGIKAAKARLRGKPIREKQPTPKPKGRRFPQDRQFIGQGGYIP